MSETQWCKTNNIGKFTFYKYQHLVRISILHSTDEPQKSFVPITAAQAVVTPNTIIRGDIKINLNGNSDMNTVMNMIKVLLCQAISKAQYIYIVSGFTVMPIKERIHDIHIQMNHCQVKI
ncbi:hypothetical protein [Thomasclavelia sp.]